uniref:Tubulin--tyrosine ligase-like protein 9 n=1 Tax=Echinostoma caproni TaxID=27848 RepID=A0A183AEA9_9TREM
LPGSRGGCDHDGGGDGGGGDGSDGDGSDGGGGGGDGAGDGGDGGDDDGGDDDGGGDGVGGDGVGGDGGGGDGGGCDVGDDGGGDGSDGGGGEGISPAPVWSSIKDVVVKTAISTEAAFNAAVSSYCNHSCSVHEVFGFDIFLDEDLQPWLLEVNVSPRQVDTLIELKNHC